MTFKKRALRAISLLAAVAPALAQSSGPGMQRPKLLRKVDPEFTQQAKDANVQGDVLLELVVDERGKPVDISVVSPLGFGLDERAVEAVAKWTFQPGTKNGQPVRTRATAEVSFRLSGLHFDARAEEQRSRYNTAVSHLASEKAPQHEKALDEIRKLSGEHFPPAMDEFGKLLLAGSLLPADPKRGVLLIEAAAKSYGPAMYNLAILYIEGKEMPADAARALKLMRDAAMLGSAGAQLHLGLQYQIGSGVALDLERARYYFRLCAASAHATCQMDLGELLLTMPNRSEHDYLQALAWLQLAGRDLPAAKQILDKETPNLTIQQAAEVEKLRGQLVRKAVAQ